MAGAIILAGGKNERTGQNKALLELGDKPLIQLITDKISQLFKQIYIVTSTPEEYNFLKGVRIVPDLLPEKNILEAIYSGLYASEEQDNFVCACDMPYLNINLIKYLFEIKGSFDVVVPVVNYKIASLHTIYSKSCLPAIEKNISKKKVSKIFRDLNVKYVPQEALAIEDPKLLSFFHIKTYLDYMLVQKDF
jgi:molybdopterin-guanine dinucleotide biosynthesis protein A